jgi:hypothetical protein
LTKSTLAQKLIIANTGKEETPREYVGEEIFMKNNKLQHKFRLVGVALTMVFGVGTLSVMAQQNPNGRPNDKDGRGNVTQNKPIDRDNDYDKDFGKNNDSYYGNNNEGRFGYGGGKEKALLRQFYNDGVKQGIEDARRGRKFNAQKAFEFATHNMNNSYSNQYKWMSKRDLRDAFTDGYEKGFRSVIVRFNDRNDRKDDHDWNH